MRSIFLMFVFVTMLLLVFRSPFLGPSVYMWIELARPHSLSFSILKGIPVSFVSALVALVAAVISRNIQLPKERLIFSLVVIWVAWFSASTFLWAEYPDAAFEKWDKSIKNVVFALFMTVVVRTRIHIEAFIFIFVITIALWTIPAGIKTLAGAGGYGSKAMILISGTPISAGGILSAVSVLTIPFLLWLKKHSVLAPKGIFRDWFFIGLIGANVLTVIGTVQRNGVVCLAALIFLIIIFQKNRLRNLLILLVVASIGAFFVPDTWTQRMDTIQNFEQSKSATGRIANWLWTMDYTESRPFGGGFKIGVNHPSGPGMEAHSAYFEVLQEHGYPGLILFLIMLYIATLKLRQMRTNTVVTVDTEWQKDLATCLLMVICVYMVGGLFVHLAFLFVLYSCLALTICLFSFQKRQQLESNTEESPPISPKAFNR